LRFDFTIDKKLTIDDLKNIEDQVNDLIYKALDVVIKEYPYEDAIKM